MRPNLYDPGPEINLPSASEGDANSILANSLETIIAKGLEKIICNTAVTRHVEAQWRIIS